MMLLGLSGGLGDYSMDTACSDIPSGDPYRVPGNYCTQPSGNVITFNDDGSIPSDPFAPQTPGQVTSGSGSDSSSNQNAWWQSALQSLATGTVKGLVSSGGTVPKPVIAPTPWYKTTWGVAAIVLGIGASAYALSR